MFLNVEGVSVKEAREKNDVSSRRACLREGSGRKR